MLYNNIQTNVIYYCFNVLLSVFAYLSLFSQLLQFGLDDLSPAGKLGMKSSGNFVDGQGN